MTVRGEGISRTDIDTFLSARDPEREAQDSAARSLNSLVRDLSAGGTEPFTSLSGLSFRCSCGFESRRYTKRWYNLCVGCGSPFLLVGVLALVAAFSEGKVKAGFVGVLLLGVFGVLPTWYYFFRRAKMRAMVPVLPSPPPLRGPTTRKGRPVRRRP